MNKLQWITKLPENWTGVSRIINLDNRDNDKLCISQRLVRENGRTIRLEMNRQEAKQLVEQLEHMLYKA